MYLQFQSSSCNTLIRLPTIAACAYRHRIGRPYNNPVNHLSYTENFLYMMDRLSEANYKPHPKLAKALDVLFILHADHEMNNSTAAMRHVGSTLVDPYTSVYVHAYFCVWWTWFPHMNSAAAAGALYGPLHGGANEQVVQMLKDIGDVKHIPQFLEDVMNKKQKLMGFGHRVYKNYDPRASIIKKVAQDVFDVCSADKNIRKLWEIAVELEKQALASDYFVQRKLFPNIDFYSGLIYNAMGFPPDMFPVLFCIPRAAGWLAHWNESLGEPNMRIFRPLQMYVGEQERQFTEMDKRASEMDKAIESYHSEFGIRRAISMQYSNNGENTPISSSPVSKQLAELRLK